VTRSILLLLLLFAAGSLEAQNLVRSDFEAVLVPAMFTNVIIEGAHGSSWQSEFWVRNVADEPVIFAHGEPWCYVCGPPPGPILLPAKTTHRPQARFSQFGRMSGLFYLEKRLSSQVFFSLRVRDITRNAESAGTAIPVAREHELFSDPFELVNVPLTDGRINLRIYSVLGDDVEVRVVLYPLMSNDPYTSRVVSLEKSFFLEPDQEFPFHPSEALVLDLASWVPADATDPVRVRIEPLSEGRFWGFASITNDTTQQVTIVAPD
jgi:hypothetical protein